MDSQLINKNTSFLDPYALMGIKADTNNMEDLNRSYRTLSLLCHPDKGGSLNDMLCVQAAYLYIKDGMQMTESSRHNINNFESFLAKYKSSGEKNDMCNYLPHVCVADDIDNMNQREHEDYVYTHEFDHAEFDKLTPSQVIPCTLPGHPRVGNHDDSEPKSTNDSIDGDTINNVMTDNNIVTYKPIMQRDLLYDWAENTAAIIDDYGTDAPLYMCDYGMAFIQDTSVIHHDPRENRCIEMLMSERD